MRDSKAAIGIGTLIVFIALILVASIAAAVIIETAQELQNQAERTGADATASATGGIAILTTVGRTHATGGPREIEELYLTVTLSAGSRGINVSATVVQFVDSNDFSLDMTVIWSTLRDYDGENTILGRDETMNLTVQGLTVAPGDEFSIRILPPNRVPGTMESYIADNDLRDRFQILI